MTQLAAPDIRGGKPLDTAPPKRAPALSKVDRAEPPCRTTLPDDLADPSLREVASPFPKCPLALPAAIEHSPLCSGRAAHPNIQPRAGGQAGPSFGTRCGVATWSAV